MLHPHPWHISKCLILISQASVDDSVQFLVMKHESRSGTSSESVLESISEVNIRNWFCYHWLFHWLSVQHLLWRPAGRLGTWTCRGWARGKLMACPAQVSSPNRIRRVSYSSHLPTATKGKRGSTSVPLVMEVLFDLSFSENSQPSLKRHGSHNTRLHHKVSF